MKYIIGNWKMNGSNQLLQEMKNTLITDNSELSVIICPPSVYLSESVRLGFTTGAQDCSAYDNGAYTGELSAKMLSEMGVKYVIVGHSERRKNHNETNSLVNAKAKKVIKNGMTPIICIGETANNYEAEKTKEVLEKQLKESSKGIKGILAYEPIWAIGTGRTPTMEEVSNIITFLKEKIKENDLKISAVLYGGSVNGIDAEAILEIENLDGVLVGGASLKPTEFQEIIDSVK